MKTNLNHWQDIALPLALCLTGLVLMGGDWLGVLSLDAIASLWPWALIGVGVVALVSDTEGQVQTTRMSNADRR